MAFKNVKNREIEKWRSDKQDQLDTHQLHGVSKIAVAAETWLNYLSVNDEWRDRETDLRRLKKKTLSETTEEELEDLYVIDDDDDEADDNAMEVDADIPADDADDQQVIDTLDEQMMDDLAEARDKKGVWVKKGEKKPDIPGSSSAPSTGEAPSSSEAVRKEAHQNALSLRKQTVAWNPAVHLQQADSVCPFPPTFRRQGFSNREVMKDAADAQKTKKEKKGPQGGQKLC